MKDDLVVVVGAGASVPCGIPGTADLTAIAIDAFQKCIEANATEFDAEPSHCADGTALANALLDVVRQAYGDRVNFELLIHVLRWLNDYTSSVGETVAFAKTMIPLGYPGPSTLFTLPRDAIAPFIGSAVLWQAHFAIVKAIHENIGHHVRHPQSMLSLEARERMRIFIRRLADDFRLILIDLNYDPLVDESRVDWVDGFADRVEDAQYSVFEPQRLWSALDDDRNVILHLHGSIQFGYPALSEDVRLTSTWEPVKYADSQIASTRLTWRGSRETIIGGEEQGIFVLLSGLEKGSHLAYNARPYGHYFLAAMTRLLRSRYLLVMGYGGNDPHLNEWLAEHARQRGQDGKAVVISPDFATWGQAPGRGEYAAARAVLGKEQWDRGGSLLKGQWRNNIGEIGALSLLNMYLPDAYDMIDEIIGLLRG